MDKCVLIKKELIEETLRTGAKRGKNLVEPLKSFALQNNLPFKILEDKEVANEAEVHKTEGDLWSCLEGEAIFTYGGELVGAEVVVQNGIPNKNELKAKEILGGTETMLRPGDWLWIPPGQPHQHRCLKTTRLIIIKIPAKTDLPNK